MSDTERTKVIYAHLSGVYWCEVWVELCVHCVDWVVLSRLGEVLGTGAGWKDILGNGHHTLRLTLTFTHTRSLTSQVTETT